MHCGVVPTTGNGSRWIAWGVGEVGGYLLGHGIVTRVCVMVAVNNVLVVQMPVTFYTDLLWENHRRHHLGVLVVAILALQEEALVSYLLAVCFYLLPLVE